MALIFSINIVNPQRYNEGYSKQWNGVTLAGTTRKMTIIYQIKIKLTTRLLKKASVIKPHWLKPNQLKIFHLQWLATHVSGSDVWDVISTVIYMRVQKGISLGRDKARWMKEESANLPTHQLLAQTLPHTEHENYLLLPCLLAYSLKLHKY